MLEGFVIVVAATRGARVTSELHFGFALAKGTWQQPPRNIWKLPKRDGHGHVAELASSRYGHVFPSFVDDCCRAYIAGTSDL